MRNPVLDIPDLLSKTNWLLTLFHFSEYIYLMSASFIDNVLINPYKTPLFAWKMSPETFKYFVQAYITKKWHAKKSVHVLWNYCS